MIYESIFVHFNKRRKNVKKIHAKVSRCKFVP